MRFAREDLKRLRLPGAVAVLLVGLGAVSVGAVDYYLAQAKKEREAARLQRVAAQGRVSKVSEEEREIRDHLVFYEKMQREGMVGQENRLDLIDSIARIKTERKLFEIKYSIEPQKPLEYPGVTRTGTAGFQVSRMRLEMQLLHEEDLLNFLSDLQSTRKSHISVRRCSVARVDRGGVGTTLSPRLRSDCQVDFITLKMG